MAIGWTRADLKRFREEKAAALNQVAEKQRFLATVPRRKRELEQALESLDEDAAREAIALDDTKRKIRFYDTAMEGGAETANLLEQLERLKKRTQSLQVQLWKRQRGEDA